MNTMKQKNQDLLTIKDLVVEFGEGKNNKRVVNHVSFSIKQGECLGLVGESGSGKTTIANAVMRFIKVREGEILFNGRNILSLQGEELRNLYREIQIIFQNPDAAQSPYIKIGRYITEVYENFFPADKFALREKAKELLFLMGLSEEYADRYPGFLSGGELQRVSIARAVSILPSLVICDEPTSALDVSVQALIVELLIKLQKEKNLTYLFISHDLPLVSYICQRVVIMYRGEIVEVLPSKEMQLHALHPYTHKLLSSTFTEQECSIAVSRDDFYKDVSGGCVFRNNCPYVKERCRREKPVLKELENNHLVACFLAFEQL